MSELTRIHQRTSAFEIIEMFWYKQHGNVHGPQGLPRGPGAHSWAATVIDTLSHLRRSYHSLISLAIPPFSTNYHVRWTLDIDINRDVAIQLRVYFQRRLGNL
jgi:hypothetical protein